MNGLHFVFTHKPLQRSLITLGVMLFATCVGLWDIDSLPSTYHFDEAYEAIDAAKILTEGARPIFLEGNGGRQPLFSYLVAGLFGLLGPTPPAVRLAAALPILGVVFGAMKAAEALFNQRIGWLTGLIAASTVLMLRIGRLGTRVSLLPLFLTLAVWQAAIAVKTGRLRHWAAAGVMLGIAYYTYLPSLFIPVVIVAILGLGFIFHRSQIVRHWRGILLCNLLMLAVAAPLFVFYLQHPAAATNRTTQVAEATFGQTPEQVQDYLTKQVGLIAGMFTVQGDDNPRHNIPYRPVFDAALALPFLLGLVLLLLKRETRFLGLAGAAWLIIFLLPTYFSDGAPHFLRSSGVLAVLFMYPAIGLDAIRQALAQTYSRLASLLVAGGILLASFNATVNDYFFSNFLASAQVFTAFDGRHTALVVHTNQLLNAGWTADNIAAKPLVPPPFTIWIQPGLWPQNAYSFFAAAQPDAYPFFKTLSSDSVLTPPFALIVEPWFEAQWLSKVQTSTSLTVENVIVGDKLFAIYRTPELLTQPYTSPGSTHHWLNDTIPGGIHWLSVEYPLTVTPGTPFEIIGHFNTSEAASDLDSALRFDLIGPDGSVVSKSPDLFDLPLQPGYTDLTFHQTAFEGTPPGVYTLTATLVNHVTLQPAAYLDANSNPINPTLSLGTLEIVRPIQPPSLDQLGSIQREAFDFGPLSLMGYTYDRAETRPGDEVFVTYFFHADETPAADLTFNLLTPYLPTSQWQSGDVLRFTAPARIPADAQGQYGLILQLTQSPDQSIQLRPLSVIAPSRSYTEPAIQHSLTSLRFEQAIELRGYSLTQTGQGWLLDLAWYVLETPPADLLAFVHVEDKAGQIVAQSDAIPADGTRPTLGWLPGEYIVDRRSFSPLSAGRYTLFVGFADPATGQRFGERLEIGAYIVGG